MTDDKAIAITLRHSVITFGGIVQTGLGAQTATRIEALTAEVERLKRALYKIQFTATQVFEPEEHPVSQAGSEA